MVVDKLQLEFEPTQLELAVGGDPVEATVSVQNHSTIVDKYTLEVAGLDPDWYSVSVPSVNLFPEDRGTFRVTFQVPVRDGVKAGSYPFRLLVRSNVGGEQRSLDARLELRGEEAWSLQLAPRRQTARGRGVFRVQLANTGLADLRLTLEARDVEEGCRFQFGDGDALLLGAGKNVEVPLAVEPKRRPWVGPEHTYEFSVTGRPSGMGGASQSVAGLFAYRPLLRSWAPLGGAVALVLASVGLVGASTLPPEQRCPTLGFVPLAGSGCATPAPAPGGGDGQTPTGPAGGGPDRAATA